MKKIGPFAASLLALWNRVSATFGLAAGSYVFCTRQAWEDVGGFDEDVYAGEELYFSRKLKAWGRARGQRFRILRETPVVTSARKVNGTANGDCSGIACDWRCVPARCAKGRRVRCGTRGRRMRPK